MMPDLDTQRILQDELDSGERIVWQGQGKPVFFRPQSIISIFISIIWVGIVGTSVFLGNHSAAGKHAPPLIMLPFLTIGLVMLVAAFSPLFATKQTYYLITNRRALIVKLGRVKRVWSYYPDKLQSLERRERAGGWGDIVIDRTAASGMMVSRSSTSLQEIGFINIPEVKKVEGILRDLVSKN